MQQSLHSSRATSAPYFTAGFWDDMEKAVLEIDFVPMAVPAYQKYISQEDMAAIITFYKSAPGQRFMASQPLIESTVGDVARKAGQQVGLEVTKKHEAEIRSLMQQPIAPQTNQAQPFEVYPAN